MLLWFKQSVYLMKLVLIQLCQNQNLKNNQPKSIHINQTHCCCISCLTIKCQCCPHIETTQLICTADHLTRFYMRATLTLNGLNL